MTDDTVQFRNDDLVLKVSESVDRAKWDDGRYERFFDELCGTREYQKEALRVVLRYLLAGEYTCLRDLARENFERNPGLNRAYGSWPGFQRLLQLPDQLTASLDLATGAGKSYVLYGIAAVLLAEGTVDQVLVLCPSTTIEHGLLGKFRDLASNGFLRDALPPDAKLSAPSIKNAGFSITPGVICVENYHAVLEHVGSSIRDSLRGKGRRTLVLNDEAHHVANESDKETKKWKAFLEDPEFDFRYIIGVSGTCYIDDNYFADVIYRYSLRQAIEQNFVKRVEYVADVPSRGPDEKWQLVRNRHLENRARLAPRGIRPLCIIVTQTIVKCKDVADELKAFLINVGDVTAEEADDSVLAIYNSAPAVPQLEVVDLPTSPVEWIVAVSMLNEGWDVKRVFLIVPHEERAFNSKLLIAQVLGRGLRIPDAWVGEQPTVTVFNHDAWAPRIRHLVSEILEIDKRLTSRVDPGSTYNFDLHSIDYTLEAVSELAPEHRREDLFALGYVDLPSDDPTEDVTVEFERAATQDSYRWHTSITRESFTAREVAELLRERIEQAIDPNETGEPQPEDIPLLEKWTVAALETVVNASFARVGREVGTDKMRQRFLQALGTLRQSPARVARFQATENSFLSLSTSERPAESVGAKELHGSKTVFFTPDARAALPDEQLELFDEVTEAGSGFKVIPVPNRLDLKTPASLVIASSDNERRFINLLVDPRNVQSYTAWLKSTPVRFYEIDFAWRKNGHLRRGKFSPDIFIKLDDLVLVVEIKDDNEIGEVTEENRRKYEYAVAHFIRVNAEATGRGLPTRYKFNFITPRNFEVFFQGLREGTVRPFRSELDVALAVPE